MSLESNGVINLASIRVYQNGSGDKVVTRHPFRRYSVLREDWQYGASSYDADGVPELELLPSCGLLCRAYVVRQDTLLADWTTTGGSWEEERPGTGAPRTKFLRQYSQAADTEFSAESNDPHISNPQLAFSLIVDDTVPDQDAATYPPLAQIEWSGGAWGIRFGANGATALLKRISGVLTPVMALPAPTAFGDANEFQVLVRHHRGRIFVSMDGGNEYQVYAEPAFITAPQGTVTFAGTGGSMSFAMHQVVNVAGVWTHQGWGTGLVDYSGLTPAITGRDYRPGLTDIDYTDEASANVARFSVTLTPQTITTGGPWDWYLSPEVYAVRLLYLGDVDPLSGLGAYTTPFDEIITQINVTKPRELDGAQATVAVQLDAQATLTLYQVRYAKAAIYHGRTTCEGDEEWLPQPLFVGYIGPIGAETGSYNNATLSFTVENPTIRFRRRKWKRSNSVPYGGMSINDALDDILSLVGWDTSHRVWHAAGAYVLPSGSPENPFEWPKPGETFWTTMQRLAGYVGLEIGATDAGLIFTVPRSYVSATVHALEAEPTVALKNAVLAMSLRHDSAETVTAIEVEGEDEFGGQIGVEAIDAVAESNPLSARFSGIGRDDELEQVDGTTTAALLTMRAQSMAAELWPLKFDGDIRLPMNPDVTRRDGATVAGLEQIGVSPSDAWVVLTLNTEIRPMVGESETMAGLARL